MSARIFHFSVLRATFARCVRGGFQSGPKEDYLRAAEGRARFEILIRDELPSRHLALFLSLLSVFSARLRAEIDLGDDTEKEGPAKFKIPAGCSPRKDHHSGPD